MADIVNTGAAANDGSGDQLRTAFRQINQRFNQLLGTLSKIEWAPGLAIEATPARQWTIQSGQAYVAASNHIAGANFAADLAAGNWLAVDAAQAVADLAQFLIDLATPAAGKGADMVAGPTGDTVAAILASLVKWVSPEEPRFGGMVGGSWHTAINAAAAYAAANGLGLRLPPRSTGHTISAPCAVPAGVPVDMSGTFLNYTGERPAVALSIGTLGSPNAGCLLIGLDVRDTRALSWPGALAAADDEGIRLIDPHEGRIWIRRVQGFTIGSDFYANDFRGLAYNQVFIGTYSNCKFANVLRTTTPSSFANENVFWGGKYACNSSANGLGDAYGTVFTWDKVNSNRGQNNNRFICPSYELSGNGTELRVPVLHDGCGVINKFQDFRHETGNGPFAICDGGAGSTTVNVYGNVYEAGYTAGASVVEGISEINLAAGNIYRHQREYHRADLTWHSGDVANFISGTTANALYVSGLLHVVQNNSTIAKAAGTGGNVEIGHESGLDYVRCNSANGVGVCFQTNTEKRFVIRAKYIESFTGRIAVQCFAADGSVLSGTAPSYATTDGLGLSSSASLGGCYNTQADGSTTLFVTFHADVAYARVAFIGGTNPAKLRSFSITAIAQGRIAGVSVFAGPGLLDDPSQRLSSAKPDAAGDIGRYARGNSVSNSSAAAGATAGWVATTAGRLAKAWETATQYRIGQIRRNGSNVYAATNDGISGATAPTHTSGTASDGVVTWTYIGPSAVFATLPNLA